MDFDEKTSGVSFFWKLNFSKLCFHNIFKNRLSSTIVLNSAKLFTLKPGKMGKFWGFNTVLNYGNTVKMRKLATSLSGKKLFYKTCKCFLWNVPNHTELTERWDFELSNLDRFHFSRSIDFTFIYKKKPNSRFLQLIVNN